MTQSTVSAEVQAAADKAKEEGLEVVYTRIAGKEFLFRPVDRSEWRQLISRRNKLLMDAGEDQAKAVEIQEDEMEELVRSCLLFPEVEVEKLRAGVVGTLGDQIMFESGFGGADIEPVRL